MKLSVFVRLFVFIGILILGNCLTDRNYDYPDSPNYAPHRGTYYQPYSKPYPNDYFYGNQNYGYGGYGQPMYNNYGNSNGSVHLPKIHAPHIHGFGGGHHHHHGGFGHFGGRRH